MSWQGDWLVELLREEHASLLGRLASAETDAQLRDVAQEAVALASSALVSHRWSSNVANYRGLAFWHFDGVAQFLAGWPRVAQHELDLPPCDRAVDASDDEHALALIAVLTTRPLIALRSRVPAAEAGSKVLILDVALASYERVAEFLFRLVLGRPIGGSPETTSLLLPLPTLRDVPDRREAFLELCRIVVDSPEAQSRRVLWSCH